MKRLLVAAVAAGCALLAGNGTAYAQDGPPQFRPVELWACNYRERKDQDDLADVLENLVEMTGEEKYAAYQLSPYYVGPEQDFDFLFLGVWADGTTMGRDMTHYLAEGSAVSSAWDETVDCPISSIFASTFIQALPAREGSGDFMLTVADCKVARGSSNGQALGALRRFNDYRVANGSTVGTVVWFPVYGGGDADFSFKLLHVFPGAQAFGDDFQWFVDKQAYLVQQDMMEGILRCDDSRVYIGRTIMDNLM